MRWANCHTCLAGATKHQHSVRAAPPARHLLGFGRAAFSKVTEEKQKKDAFLFMFVLFFKENVF